MASKQQLVGSFNSLSDSLAFRFDPSFPPEVSGRWLGTMGHSAATAHRSGEWLALPGESPAFDGPVAALTGATIAVTTANDDGRRLAALAEADAALAQVDALLDAVGLGA